MPIETHVPDSTFVTAIAGLVKQEPDFRPFPRGQSIILVGDKHTLIGNPLLAEPKTLRVATLGAIVDAYKQAPIFETTSDKLTVHVVSPTEVRLVSPSVGEERQQFIYMSAQVETKQLSYGHFYPLEDFIIAMHSLFQWNGDQARLLEYIGSLTTGLVTDITDDGAGQSTVTKAGITRAGAPTKWENPVGLQPYRTFAEVEQPASKFAFRLQQKQDGEKKVANCALFEADGGAWKLEAIQSIGEYLRAALPKNAVVLA